MKMLAASTLFALSICCLSSSAQTMDVKELAQMNKWQFNQIDWGIGLDNDHFGTISYDDIMAFAKDPAQLQRDLQGMDEEVTAVTYGAAYYTNFSFSPLNLSDGTYRTDREVRVGIGLHSDKEAMLSYKSEDMDTSIIYCNVQSQISLEGAYLYKGMWGNRFHYYCGLGASVATSFNNSMMVIPGRYFGPDEHPSEQENFEENVEIYDAKSVSYLRVYIPYGIGYGIGNRVILGLDFRTGIGYQKIQGTNVELIKKTGSFVIGVKFRFR